MSLEADAGSKLDQSLLKLRLKRSKIKNVKRTGSGDLNSLLVPIKWELESIKTIAIAIRRNAMRQLFLEEMQQYECELRERGLCLSRANW